MSKSPEEQHLAEIEERIGLYPDFPIKGVLFRDIMPILADPRMRGLLYRVMSSKVQSLTIDTIVGIESRGFLLGPSLADSLSLPFVPIRKKGKLPGELLSIDYELEYGKDTLQAQKSSIHPNQNYLLVDDLIATGGSLGAAKRLIEDNGGKVVACIVVIELAGLKGRDKIGQTPLISLYSY